MKSITTIILLILISCKCSSVNKNSVGIVRFEDATLSTNMLDTTAEPYNPKQILYDSCITGGASPQCDTIKCIMLVCDTSYIQGLSDAYVLYNSNDSTESIGEMHYHVPQVYWQYGYKVLSFVAQYWDEQDRQMGGNYVIQLYLDEYKKPLSKSTVIWQSKEVIK